jgi:uncharacterized damage-inducible protein DinB
MTDLRYPIGKFNFAGELSASDRARMIEQIAEAPTKLRTAVANLSAAQLDTPYRPEGWTIRQVVHHVPESHMNAYIRFKLALTEAEPLIKPYREDLWAELPDVGDTPIELSLSLLDSLHRRWVIVLSGIESAAWARTFRHPEIGVMTLDRTLALYAWHGRHHVAHITSLRQRMGDGWK